MKELYDPTARAEWIAQFIEDPRLRRSMQEKIEEELRVAMGSVFERNADLAGFEKLAEEWGCSGFCGGCGNPYEIEWDHEEGSNGPDANGGYQTWNIGIAASACCDHAVYDDPALTIESTATPPDPLDDDPL